MFPRTLSLHAQTTLAFLGKSGILDKSYLAGGSTLALHLGHRKSYDFDFYTRQHFIVEDVAAQFKKLGDFKTVLLEPPHTLLGEFEGVKLSLFHYDYPLIGKLTHFKNVMLASVKDIAAMKISAISGRATKRDYVDLFFLTKIYSLEEIFDMYEKKYGKLSNNIYHIIKAIGYFSDTQKDDMPRMIKKTSWEQVKQFFANESLRLGKKYLLDRTSR